MPHTPLFRAVKHGNLSAARQLLESGADPDESGNDRAPLRVAAERGDVPMLRLLLERGAQVNGGTAHGWTALAAAALANHVDAVRVLLAAGASHDLCPGGYPLLNWLEWSGHRDAQRVRVINTLRDAGAKKQPQWWLEIRWRITYRWTRVLRCIGMKKGIAHPPGPPPIPLLSVESPTKDSGENQ
jgi:ankyrin repeat protein